MNNDSVLVAILTGNERDGWLAPGLAGFFFGIGKSSNVKRDIQFELMHNVRPVDAARNAIAESFLNSGCEWLCSIDNDTVPPQNLLEMIDRAEEHMDIIVPMSYTTANFVHRGAPTELGIAGAWLPRQKTAISCDWVELDLVSSGVLLARRRVFERMPKPFFRFVYDEDGRVTECEDLFFSRKARETGLSIWGNQKFYAEHYKTLPLSLPARNGTRWLSVVSGRFPGVKG
jgi:hypothetical protein